VCALPIITNESIARNSNLCEDQREQEQGALQEMLDVEKCGISSSCKVAVIQGDACGSGMGANRREEVQEEEELDVLLCEAMGRVLRPSELMIRKAESVVRAVWRWS
jgi:hypothetical protein